MRNGIFRKRDKNKTVIGHILRWNCHTFELPADLHIPDDDQIRAWILDYEQCTTPTGYTVEVDGYGPDGCPSWCIILGIV